MNYVFTIILVSLLFLLGFCMKPAYPSELSAQSDDVCSKGVSLGIQTFNTKVSKGRGKTDLNCERIKLAKTLHDFGKKIAAISLLCQDDRVFIAMENAGTPCPIDGKIGVEASELWLTYAHERPDYKEYMKKMQERYNIDRINKTLEPKR